MNKVKGHIQHYLVKGHYQHYLVKGHATSTLRKTLQWWQAVLRIQMASADEITPQEETSNKRYNFRPLSHRNQRMMDELHMNQQAESTEENRTNQSDNTSTPKIQYHGHNNQRQLYNQNEDEIEIQSIWESDDSHSNHIPRSQEGSRQNSRMKLNQHEIPGQVKTLERPQLKRNNHSTDGNYEPPPYHPTQSQRNQKYDRYNMQRDTYISRTMRRMEQEDDEYRYNFDKECRYNEDRYNDEESDDEQENEGNRLEGLFTQMCEIHEQANNQMNMMQTQMNNKVSSILKQIQSEINSRQGPLYKRSKKRENRTEHVMNENNNQNEDQFRRIRMIQQQYNINQDMNQDQATYLPQSNIDSRNTQDQGRQQNGTNMQKDNQSIGSNFSNQMIHDSTKLPQYSGKTDFNDFIIQFECIATSKGWNDKTKGEKLVMSLEGNAISVLGALPKQDRMNFKALKDALEKRFKPKLDPILAGNLIQNRKRKKGESYSIFAQELKKLVTNVYEGCSRETIEQKTLQAFCNAVTDQQLVGLLWAKSPSTVEEAAIYAESLEATFDQNRNSQNHFQQEANFHMKPDWRDNNHDRRKQGYDSSPNKQGNTCYECLQFGHYARDCPQRRRNRGQNSPNYGNERQNDIYFDQYPDGQSWGYNQNQYNRGQNNDARQNHYNRYNNGQNRGSNKGYQYPHRNNSPHSNNNRHNSSNQNMGNQSQQRRINAMTTQMNDYENNQNFFQHSNQDMYDGDCYSDQMMYQGPTYQPDNNTQVVQGQGSNQMQQIPGNYIPIQPRYNQQQCQGNL